MRADLLLGKLHNEFWRPKPHTVLLSVHMFTVMQPLKTSCTEMIYLARALSNECPDASIASMSIKEALHFWCWMVPAQSCATVCCKWRPTCHNICILNPVLHVWLVIAQLSNS